MARCLLSLLSLLCLVQPHIFWAQDASPPADVVVEASSEAEDAPADGEAPQSGEETAGSPSKTAGSPTKTLEDSAKELQDKLGQLKDLLAKRGGADPAMTEKLEKLTKSLSSLGLGGLDMGSSGQKDAEQQVLAACLTLAIKRAGARRSDTFNTMRKLSSGKLKPEEASELPLVRMVAVCVNGLSDKEYKKFTAGTLDSLPKALADKAALPAAKAEVLAMENEIPGVWDQLAKVAGPMFSTMKEAAGNEAGAPPNMYGLLAAIPLLLAVAFLAKKFFDMQRAQREKEEQKKEKAERKKAK